LVPITNQEDPATKIEKIAITTIISIRVKAFLFLIIIIILNYKAFNSVEVVILLLMSTSVIVNIS